MTTDHGNPIRQAIHKINLKGPWVVQKLTKSGEQMSPDKRLRIESNWASQFEGARLRLTRSFNRPTGLGRSSQEVFLKIESKNIEGAVELNDQPLGQLSTDVSSSKFLCLDHLKSSNRVSIEIESVIQKAELAVSLEISG